MLLQGIDWTSKKACSYWRRNWLVRDGYNMYISRPPASKWMRADEAVLINDSEAIKKDTSHYWEDIGIAK